MSLHYMSIDNCVQVNITDSESEELPEPQPAISPTLQFKRHIQQEILNPAVHEIQPLLIATYSTLRHNCMVAKPKKFGRFASPTPYKYSSILQTERERKLHHYLL